MRRAAAIGLGLIGATLTLTAFAAVETRAALRPSQRLLRAMAAFDLRGMMHEIAAATGEKEDFVIVERPDVTGAKAVYSAEGLREVEIEKLTFDDIEGGERWDAVFILAHEAGHFVFGHVGRPGGDYAGTRQLEADSFAGFACYRLGATLDETTHCLRTDGLVGQSRPSLDERVRAASYGWRLGHLTNSRFVLRMASLPAHLVEFIDGRK
jgi:hypothetical protein